MHRAVLKKELGGGDVVVKVQHRNIDKRVRQDLADLALLMKIVAYFEPDYDFTPIVSEWSSEVCIELQCSLIDELLIILLPPRFPRNLTL